MGQRNIVGIDNTFRRLQEEITEKVRKVYDDILRQLKNTVGREVGGEIAQLEARTLNNLTLSFMDDVKQAAISVMVANGCETYLTQTGWTEIQQVVGVPCIELCKVKVDRVWLGKSNTEDNSCKSENRHKRSEVSKNKFRDGILPGAIIAAILIIPGWGAPVKFTLAAGTLVVVAGLRGYKQQELADSKFKDALKDSQKQPEEGLETVLSKIVNSQQKHNLKRYLEWLEKVKSALIQECDKLSEM